MNNLKIQGGLYFSLALVLLLCLSAVPAFADDDSDSVDVTVTVPPLVQLTLSTNSLVWTANQITVSRYNAGYSHSQSISMTVKSNTNWQIDVRGSSASFTGPWAKPVGDIEWVDGGQTYTPLTQTDAYVYNGTPTDGDPPYSIQFRIKLDWEDDVPGTYTYENIVLTLYNT